MRFISFAQSPSELHDGCVLVLKAFHSRYALEKRGIIIIEVNGYEHLRTVQTRLEVWIDMATGMGG